MAQRTKKTKITEPSEYSKIFTTCWRKVDKSDDTIRELYRSQLQRCAIKQHFLVNVYPLVSSCKCKVECPVDAIESWGINNLQIIETKMIFDHHLECNLGFSNLLLIQIQRQQKKSTKLCVTLSIITAATPHLQDYCDKDNRNQQEKQVFEKPGHPVDPVCESHHFHGFFQTLLLLIDKFLECKQWKRPKSNSFILQKYIKNEEYNQTKSS